MNRSKFLTIVIGAVLAPFAKLMAEAKKPQVVFLINLTDGTQVHVRGCRTSSCRVERIVTEDTVHGIYLVPVKRTTPQIETFQQWYDADGRVIASTPMSKIKSLELYCE
jgi:hypothetical protein